METSKIILIKDKIYFNNVRALVLYQSPFLFILWHKMIIQLQIFLDKMQYKKHYIAQVKILQK
ncbi:MAG: hypothetical protein JG780_1572 [Thermosipho sp. (in: Bacteria)]|jgi:hypothetical protein|nr:hypothetical protein [Thermosipho sp. (in: thermotogales)]